MLSDTRRARDHQPWMRMAGRSNGGTGTKPEGTRTESVGWAEVEEEEEGGGLVDRSSDLNGAEFDI